MRALSNLSYKQRCIAAALCCIGAGAAAQAQPAPPVTMPAEKAAPTLLPAEVPPTNAAVGARFRCGGVSSDESGAMRVQLKDHPLSLRFAQTNGADLADVDVNIQGGENQAPLNFRADGPVCLVDLPAGRYTVQAASGGVTRTQHVTLVAGAAKTVDFRF